MERHHGILLLLALVSPGFGFQTISFHRPAPSLFSTTEQSSPEFKSKKDQRRKIMASPDFHRSGFKDVRKTVKDGMDVEFGSEVVKTLKTNR